MTCSRYPWEGGTLTCTTHLPNSHPHTPQPLPPHTHTNLPQTSPQLRANDPVGYISDILAWIHKAVAGEGEVLVALFGGLPIEGGGIDLGEMMSQTTSGVARPFKSRTLSVIENLAFSNDDVVEMDEAGCRYKIVSLYSAFGVLQFYHNQLQKAAQRCVGGEGGITSLLASIAECLDAAAKIYDNSLKCHGESVKLFAGQGRTGWGRSASVARDTVGSLAVRLVAELTDTNAMSPGFAATKTTNPDLEEITSVDHAIACTFTPAVHLTDQIDDLLKLRDCLSDVKVIGEECKAKWEENIDNKFKRLKEGLVDKVVKGIMEKVGLASILALMEGLEDATMITVVGLEEANIAKSLAVFYSFLANFPIPDFDDEVDSTVIRVQLRGEVVREVVKGYRKVADMVQEQGGYQDVLSWLLHSPDDVEALLCV